MATNDFLPHATATGANVTSQGSWDGSAARLSGFVAGTASSADANKALRQGTSFAAAIGEFVSAHGYDALDDGDISALADNFEAALAALIAANGTLHYGTDTGTTNAIVATAVVPAITAYADGQVFEIAAANTTSSTAPTLKIGALSARPVVHADGTALVVGELVAGAKFLAAYDSGLNKFMLLAVPKAYIDAKNAASSVSYVTTTQTVTVPANVTRARARGWGAGGGGGGSYGTGSGGSAGGGGAHFDVLVSVTAGASIVCTIGAGGAAGAATPTDGGGGGTTSFGSIASATGGAGGVLGNSGGSTTPSTGGTATISSGTGLALDGLTGGTPVIVSPTNCIGGSGGGSPFGGTGIDIANNNPGHGGAYPGGGGGGGSYGQYGGQGSAGLIIIQWLP